MTSEQHPNPDCEAAANLLDSNDDYRVLRRLEPRRQYADLGNEPIKKGLIIDLETTGLTFRSDNIIELGMVPFEYGIDTGKVGRVEEPISFFEDPGRPIPPEIIKLTGITDDMVRGQRIENPAVRRQFESAHLIIAHNAGFDRPFVDTRFNFVGGKPWACSQKDVPWREMGLPCRALGCLLLHHCSAFFDGHRAGLDCQAVVHLLATPFEDGSIPMKVLLESARAKTYRIWAIDSPFDTKDALKARGYRWNNGTDGRPKAWWREVKADERTAEHEWLTQNVYTGRKDRRQENTLDATTRYTS